MAIRGPMLASPARQGFGLPHGSATLGEPGELPVEHRGVPHR